MAQSNENTWNLIYNEIALILKECGPRAPCSEAERKAAGILKTELKTLTEDVHDESFTCHPRSFDGWPRFSVCFCILSIAIFFLSYVGVPLWLSAFLALATVIFLFYCIWRQFFNYEEFVHRFIPYKEGTSQNIYGVFKTPQPAKKRVIFAGHYDSSFRFNLMQWFDVGYSFFIFGGVGNLFLVTIIYGIAFFSSIIAFETTLIFTIIYWLCILMTIFYAFYILVAGKSDKIFFGALKKPSKRTVFVIILSTIYALAWEFGLYFWLFDSISSQKIAILVGICSIPFFLSLFLFLGRDAVPGAIDNLSAVGVCMALASYMKTQKQIKNPLFNETEVVILFTGAEEAGDRGAEAFSKLHSAQYNTINTVVVNLESFADPNLQKIITDELTTRTKCSPEIYNLLAECAKELDLKYKLQALPAIAGGTDCAGFVKGGLRCSGLEGIRYQDYLHWYHSDRDDLASITSKKDAMVNAYNICVRFLEKF